VRRFLFLVLSEGGGGERDLTLQCTGGIGLMSGVLGALPGLGLLLLSVRGVLPMGGACEIVIYKNLYYLVSGFLIQSI
jgi:hypothetical protein